MEPWPVLRLAQEGARTTDRLDNVRMPNVRKKEFVCRNIVWDKVIRYNVCNGKCS